MSSFRERCIRPGIDIILPTIRTRRSGCGLLPRQANTRARSLGQYAEESGKDDAAVEKYATFRTWCGVQLSSAGHGDAGQTPHRREGLAHFWSLLACSSAKIDHSTCRRGGAALAGSRCKRCRQRGHWRSAGALGIDMAGRIEQPPALVKATLHFVAGKKSQPHGQGRAGQHRRRLPLPCASANVGLPGGHSATRYGRGHKALYTFGNRWRPRLDFLGISTTFSPSGKYSRPSR